MDIDVDGEGFLDGLEELAEANVIGYVIYCIFYIFSWPFISVSRLIIFVLSFGRVRPNYKNSFISMLAITLFLPVLFWFLIIVVPMI